MASFNNKVDAKVADMKKADTGSTDSFSSIFGTSSLFGGSSLFGTSSLFNTGPSTLSTSTTTSTSPFGSSSIFGDSPLFSSSLFPSTSYTPSFSISAEKPKPKPEDQKDFDAKVNKIMEDMKKKEEETKKSSDSGGLGSLFGSGLFSSSSLFAGSSLLSSPTTPAPDTGKKAFESRMTETLGGSSLFQTTTPLSTTTPSTSPFSSSIFGNSPLFSPSFLSATTPVTPPQKTEEEKKKEFDERMKSMGLFTGKTDTKSNDVATNALGSFSSILNLSAVPEKKEKKLKPRKKKNLMNGWPLSLEKNLELLLRKKK